MADERPLPSQIDYGRRGPSPFIACFGRFECELAAALYVAACEQRDDRWQPLGPRDLGETLVGLAKDPSGPSWAKFVATFGLMPDFVSLFNHGWFAKHADDRIEPTDMFFEIIERRGYVRREVADAG